MKKLSEKQIVLFLFLLALILRVLYVAGLEEKWYFFDTIYYDTAAQNLVKGNGFGPSVYFQNLYDHYCLEPLYPLFLACAYSMFGHSLLAARMYQVVLGMAVLLLLYVISKRMFSPQSAKWVLLYGAIYPFFVYITGFLYITQLFTLLIVLQVFIFYLFEQSQRAGWLVAGGVVLGLAVLARPIYLLGLPLFYMWVFFACRGRFAKKLLFVSLAVLFTLLALTPWTIRNYVVFDKFAFARACISQGEVYDNSFWEIQKRKVYLEHGFQIQEMGVSLYQENGRRAFDFFVDGKPEYKFVSLEEVPLPDSLSYCGILFCGPVKNQLKSVRAYRRTLTKTDTTDQLVFDSESPGVDFVHVPNVQKTDSLFVFDADGKYWDYPAIFTAGSRANYYEMRYAAGTSARQARRVAMLIGLDKPQLDASGIMVWLHPWGEPDIWRYENGNPTASVQVLKFPYDTERYSFKNLLFSYPKEFFLVHYFPKFFRFWSPLVTGVRNEEQQPGPLLQIVSVTFFLPVLVLLPFGIWRARKNLLALVLIIIPVVTLGFGYSIYGAQTRYRIPIDGFLILLAVQGFFMLRGLKKES